MRTAKLVLAAMILSSAITTARAEGEEDGIPTLPTVDAVPPPTFFCTGAICEGLRQSLEMGHWDAVEQELFAEGGGGAMTREQFCEALRNGAPPGCDADNPPSSPGIDPNWMANGCGDGSFKSYFAEKAIALTLDDYTGELDHPFPGISFYGACSAHDRCYGTDLSKLSCDTYFRRQLDSACGTSSTFSNECHSLAAGMEGAVAMFGDSAYADAQTARQCAAWVDDMEANQCDEE